MATAGQRASGATALGRHAMTRKMRSPTLNPFWSTRVHLRGTDSSRRLAVAAGFAVAFEVSESFPVPAGHILSVVGSAEQLGNWNPVQGLQLQQGPNGMWVAESTLDALAGTTVEYKLVRGPAQSNGVAWETIANRKLQVPATPEALQVSCAWDVMGGSVKASPPRSPTPPTPEVITAATTTPDAAIPAPVVTAPPTPAVAPAPAGQVPCRLVLLVPDAVPAVGLQYVVVGDCPQLGDWDVKAGLQLTSLGGGNMLGADVTLPARQAVDCKVVAVQSNGQAVWEGGANRVLQMTPPPASQQGRANVLITHNVPASVRVVYAPDAQGDLVPPPTTLPATCIITVPSHPAAADQQLLLVGSLPQLGDWKAEWAPVMQRLADGGWQLSLDLPLAAVAEAKLVVRDPSGALHWEGGPNRHINVSGGNQPISSLATAATSLITLFATTPTVAPTLVLPVIPAVVVAVEAVEAKAVVVEDVVATTEPAVEAVAVPEEGKGEEQALGRFLKLLFSSISSGDATQEQVLAAGRAAAAAGTEAAMFTLHQLEEQVAKLKAELGGSAYAVEGTTDEAAAMMTTQSEVTGPPSWMPLLGQPEAVPEMDEDEEVVPVVASLPVVVEVVESALEAEPPVPVPLVVEKKRPARVSTRTRTGSPRRKSESPRPIGPPPEEMAAYESHVMAVLGLYPSRSTEQLQQMMQAATMAPLYDKSEDQLTQLLTYLVAQGTITSDAQGLYRLRDIALPRIRQRSPSSPRTARSAPAPALSASPPTWPTTPAPPAAPPAPVPAVPSRPSPEELVLAYGEAVVVMMAGQGAVTVDRVGELLALGPKGFAYEFEDLEVLLSTLTTQGKLDAANGLYTLPAPPAPAAAPKTRRKRSSAAPAVAEALPPVVAGNVVVAPVSAARKTRKRATPAQEPVTTPLQAAAAQDAQDVVVSLPSPPRNTSPTREAPWDQQQQQQGAARGTSPAAPKTRAMSVDRGVPK